MQTKDFLSLVPAVFLAAGGTGAPTAAAADDTAPPGGTIAYAATGLRWAVYASGDDRTECPTGVNEGNREQFEKLFPNDGTPRTLVDTQLRREIDGWFPTTAPEPFAFHEAQGHISYGLNLDEKVGPNDFTSPEGEPGVDNQLYRVIGCLNGYRKPDAVPAGSDTVAVGYFVFNRIIVQLSDVQSLVNDDDVTVTTYRGRDPIPMDATGNNAIPGGFQRIDTRWGSRYIKHWHGKITNGILITEPADWVFPWASFAPMATDRNLYGARFKLKLTATGAEGIIGGYADVEQFYFQLLRSWGTYWLATGQLSAPSMYKALRRLADARPDARTGENTAISSALLAKFTLVKIAPSSLPPINEAKSQHPEPSFAGDISPKPAAEEYYPNSRETVGASTATVK